MSSTFGVTDVFTCKSRRPRPVAPHAIVLHDTVSHSAFGAMRTLNAKGYGTHFIIEPSGRIFQTADPRREAVSHCGGFNDASIGVDVVAILSPKLATGDERTRIVERSWSAAAGKWSGKVVDYTAEQRVSVALLVRSLCDVFAIPHYVLDAQTGYGAKVPGLSPAFRGVLAHAQWSTARWDGLLAVESLIADGFEHDGGTP